MVVLPLPLSPISETTSPGSTSKLTSRTAGHRCPPNVPDLKTFVTSSSASIRPPPSSRPLRPGATSTNGGSSAHFVERERAAVAEAAARGGLSSDGGRPGMPVSRSLRVAHADLGQRGDQELRVRVERRSVIVSAGAFSASLPAYITRIVSAIW